MTLIPLSSELPVNTYTTGDQSLPAIAIDARGNFVVAWASEAQDGSNYGIYAQRYNAKGKTLDDEFRVNTSTFNAQIFPQVAMDIDGDFVATWQSFSDGNDYGIFAQRYTSSGKAAGDDIPVNSFTTARQIGASVAMDADGDFVATWVSETQDGSGRGIFAQRFDAKGDPAGKEFQVNQETESSQNAADIAIDAKGNFVVTWMSNAQDGSGYGIYARRYSASGSPLSQEFKVNSYTINTQQFPAIAMNAAGEFAIAWESVDQDGDGTGIYAQRYKVNGDKDGNEFRVNKFTVGDQSLADIAMDDQGDLLVTWQSDEQDGDSTGIFMKEIRKSDSKAPANLPDIPVNTYTTGAQTSSAIAMNRDGTFAVVWSSLGQDESGTGIFARQFSAPSAVEFTKGTYKVNEKGRPVGAAVKLTRTNSLVPATVKVVLKGKSAGKADYDVKASPLEVTFKPGQDTKKLKIPVLQDTKVEGTETLQASLRISDPNAELGDRTKATIKIIDDDSKSRKRATGDRLLGLSDGDALLGEGAEPMMATEPDRDYAKQAIALPFGSLPSSGTALPEREDPVPFASTGLTWTEPSFGGGASADF